MCFGLRTKAKNKTFRHCGAYRNPFKVTAQIFNFQPTKKWCPYAERIAACAAMTVFYVFILKFNTP
jgi:hypothetical protein